MHTWAVKGGDLRLDGGRFATVAGRARVQQQIGLCLREPYASDRFHPEWGSVLPEWIGGVIDPVTTVLDVRTEIIRVIKLFMAAQSLAANRRAALGQRSVLASDEVIADVSGVDVVQVQDAIFAKVGLVMASNRGLSVVATTGG